MRKLAILALLALVVSCGDDATAPPDIQSPARPGRLIQDALHNAGNPFFFWLAPMVAQPKAEAFGTLDAAADPVVRVICEAASSSSHCPGGVGSEVASFTMTSGVTFSVDQYQLDFDTKATYGGYALLTSEADQDPFTTYRLEVFIPGAQGPALIGVADFQLGESGADARNLAEPDQLIGLKDGRILPVKFRIDAFAYEFATATEDPCPNGCSVTRIDEDTGGTAYYVDEETGVAVTGVQFKATDLPPSEQDYTLLIGPLSTGDEISITSERDPRDLCAFDVVLQKYDCFRYTIFPDPEQFNNPVRFGICRRAVPESEYVRLVKVDRDANDQPIVVYPDPVEVTDFLPCIFPEGSNGTAMLDRLLRLAFERLVPPLFAQTTTKTWGGMADDFSDVFHTIEDGLVSHWTADQLLSPYDDAMLYNETLNNGTPNAAVDIVADGGIEGDAFRFAAPVFDPATGALTTEGGVILAPASGVAPLQTLSLSGWVGIRLEAPQNVIHRFVTIQPEKAVLRMDGETQPGQLDFYASFEGAEGPEIVHVRYPGPLAQGCYQHVAATYDGSALRLYLNGVEVASTPHVGTLIDGSGVELSSPHETLRGRLDEVRIHDRALNATEVAALFAAGSPDPCPAPADLQVTALSFDPASPTVGDDVTITTTVTNTGTNAAGASHLVIALPGEAVGTAHAIGRLEPGASQSVTRTFQAAGDGTLEVSATADYLGTVFEANEANNTATAELVVGAPVVHSIVLTPLELEMFVGNTRQIHAQLLTASGEEISGEPVTWTSSNSSVATVDRTGLVTAVAPGLVSIRASSGDAIAAAMVEVISGLVLHYAFEGDLTNTGELSGYNGTAANVTFPAGKRGEAIKFDGTDGTRAVLTGTNEVFAMGGSQWTISLWFKEDQLKTTSRLFDIRGAKGWETYHGVTETQMTTCSDAGCTSFDSPALGKWHNLIYRYNGISATQGAPVDIYLNGVLAGRIENTGSIPLVGPGAEVMEIWLGNAPELRPSVYYVDELKVYNLVFTLPLQCTEVIGGTWSAETSTCTLP